MEAAYSNRALTTSTGTGGVGVILESDYIELLRNAMVLNQLGSTIMAGMTGKFSIPRQSGGATAYWVGESGAPTASNQTLDQVAFVPKTVGAYTDISRQFINQTSIDAENFVKNDLTKVIAIAIDTAGLVGTGSSNQPTGITNTSGIISVSHGTNGGAETWPLIVSYETDVLAANVSPTAKLSYVGNSKVSGALKQLDKTTGGFGQFVLGPDGKVNNYNFAVTNSLPATGTKGSGTGLSTMIYGNFADLVVAFWNGLDLMVDPYTGSSSGTVRIVALQDVDVEVRHPLSFAVATDIIA
jgi:HK97 family phage major capsid protein